MWTRNVDPAIVNFLCSAASIFLLSVALSQSQQHSRESGENSRSACSLPEAWIGQWNQAGNDGSVTITNILDYGVDDHGTCVQMQTIGEGDVDAKFLTVKLVNRFEDHQEFCYKYMLITRVHENVLKYKEGGVCHDDLASALEDYGLEDHYRNIYRDRAIPCPFQSSSYEFTYNKGGRECATPVSKLQVCTVAAKRVLEFQACPDVSGTESIAKVLTCFGNWAEDGTDYLFGELAVKNNHYHEVTYRCLNLIRDIHSHEIRQIAFPEDASCYPLSESSAFHPQILALRRPSSFPQVSPDKLAWFANSSRWDSLNGSMQLKMSGASTRTSYAFALDVFTIDSSGAPKLLYMLEIVASHENSEDRSIFSAIRVEECMRTPVCLHFYKRSSDVIEVSMYEDDNCEIVVPGFLDSHSTTVSVSSTTFIRAQADTDDLGLEKSVPCPFPGKYSITKAVRHDDLIWKCSNQSFNTLIIGCATRRTESECSVRSSMQLYSCVAGVLPVAELICRASWEENGKTYVIVRQEISSSDSGSSNDVTQNHDGRHRCLEIEKSSSPDATMTMTIKANRNSCKKSYKENPPNEWEVTTVFLTDSSADKLNSGSASTRMSASMSMASMTSTPIFLCLYRVFALFT